MRGCYSPAICLLIAWLLAPPVQADTVACHLTYGGETQVIRSEPVTSPYAVAPTAIGSYFLFRIVFRQEPADLAGISLYTYADHERGPLPIHQARYRYPVSNAPSGGFTGFITVYEPLRDGELQYWCEMSPAR